MKKDTILLDKTERVGYYRSMVKVIENINKATGFAASFWSMAIQVATIIIF